MPLPSIRPAASRLLSQAVAASKPASTSLHCLRAASTASSTPNLPSSSRPKKYLTKRVLGKDTDALDLWTAKEPHPIYDAWSSITHENSPDVPSVTDSSVLHFNEPPPFPVPSEVEEQSRRATRALIDANNQHTYVLLRKRVVHQTGKGKISTMYYGVVVGNGKGVVGFGDAKSDDQGAGIAKATKNALKNCDAIELFEGRTIWTDMRIKFGSTELHLRPRPRGFGLMCNPYVHQVCCSLPPRNVCLIAVQVCKAAGIKDISAKVHGSRNPMAVIKATLMLLHSGGEPLGMGDGIGGHGRREDKKQGIKSLETMERERGRSFVEGGAWI